MADIAADSKLSEGAVRNHLSEAINEVRGEEPRLGGPRGAGEGLILGIQSPQR